MGSKYCVQRALIRVILFLFIATTFLCGLPATAMSGDDAGPAINNGWLGRHLPQLKKPRLMTEGDIRNKDERDTYQKEGWSFVLKGDFDKDGFPDYCVSGKYDGPYPGKSIFVAIFTKKNDAIVPRLLYKHSIPANVAFLMREKGSSVDMELPPVAGNYDIISVAFALYTEYGFVIIWNGKEYVIIPSEL